MTTKEMRELMASRQALQSLLTEARLSERRRCAAILEESSPFFDMENGDAERVLLAVRLIEEGATSEEARSKFHQVHEYHPPAIAGGYLDTDTEGDFQ